MTPTLKQFITDRDYFESLLYEIAEINYKMNNLRNACFARNMTKKQKAKKEANKQAAIDRKEHLKAEVKRIVAEAPPYISRWKPHLIDSEGKPQDFRVVKAFPTASTQRNKVRKELETQGKLTQADINEPSMYARGYTPTDRPKRLPRIITVPSYRATV